MSNAFHNQTPSTRSRTARELVTEIAEYLAAENREDVSRVHLGQADEILAMVRERDRVERFSEQQS